MLRLSPFFLAIALIAVAMPTALRGQDNEERIAEQNRQLELIQGRIQAVLGNLESKQQEQGGLEQQLRTVEMSLGVKIREIRKLDNRLSRSHEKLADLEGKRRSLNAKLAEQRRKLAAQLRSAYLAGNQAQLKLLLNQQDPSALARMLRYYEYLNRARLKTIGETQTVLDSLRDIEARIAASSAELEQLRLQGGQEREALAEQRRNRQAVLEKLQREISEHRQSVAHLRQDESRIRELIASLSGIFADIPVNAQTTLVFEQLKGHLPWPVRGNILNAFGDSRAGSDLVWQGLRIGAPRGSEVRAVSHGRVAFADWLPGFGLLLIIDHNHGYISLYAHNEALYKEAGNWVQEGEVIATVGNSGGEQQAALYFEIRYEGKPVDPKKWCNSLKS